MEGDELKPGRTSETTVSLSQVLLAPLDALFKAQVHAARSFLSFILQLSYNYKSPDATPDPEKPDTIHSIEFVHEVPGPATTGALSTSTVLQRVKVPALALVPLRPLTIEQAEFELAMEVKWIAPHRQTKQNEREQVATENKTSGENRPWYLVDDPISLRGHVAAQPGSEPLRGENPVIKVSVKVGPAPTPAGLEKLLSTLTQAASVSNTEPSGTK